MTPSLPPTTHTHTRALTRSPALHPSVNAWDLFESILPGQRFKSETNLFPLQVSHYPTPSLDYLSGYFAKSQTFNACSGRNEICTEKEAPCNGAETRDVCSKLCQADYSCISFEWHVSANGCQMSTTCTGASSGSNNNDWELWIKTWRSFNDGKYALSIYAA